MKTLRDALLLVTLSTLTCARPAAAHFKLSQPPSWLKEDSLGGPQKGGPCGPGGGDNVNPTPVSNIVTEFQAGQTIEVQWVDTIAHPGYFRIALAENRADFKDPTITQDALCDFDETMVPKTASGNVLADGIYFRTRNGFNAQAGVMFSQMVTLPNQPCDKCTLQVMQVMENDIQSLSNCHYYHCADIKITAGGGSTGSGGTASTGSGGATMTGGGGLGIAGLPMGSGGVDVGTSSGGMFGLGGVLGMGGTTVGTTGTGTVGTAGSGVTPPPATGSGGAAAPAGTGTASGGTVGLAPAGAAGAVTGESDDKSGGCAVALRSRAGTSALASVALLAFFGFARRRSLRSSRRK
ncbi:MAG TPA: SCE4755 family polysaccharide monooxygenase-like protein [Polyangiaceae bacterium]|nr:SCE4755 family polysaccharide monooxygenase-like protein [Polyangiaceae bacterium]